MVWNPENCKPGVVEPTIPGSKKWDDVNIAVWPDWKFCTDKLPDGIVWIGILILVDAVKVTSLLVVNPNKAPTPYSLLYYGEYGSTPLCNIVTYWLSKFSKKSL